MDLGSPDKSFVETEDQQRDDGSPPGGKLDLGRAMRKGEGYDPESEAWHDSLQEDYLNQREYQGSPMLPYDVSDVGINSHIVMSESKTREEPCSQIQSGLYHDDMGMRISNSEGRRSPSQVRGCPDQSDVVDCSASDELHLPVQNEKLHTEIETKDSALYLEKCFVAVNRKHPQENLENEDSSHQSQELPVHDESVNEHPSHILGNTKSEEADIFHQEKDVGNAVRPNEIKEDIYDSGKPPFDNEEDVHGDSGNNSSQQDWKKSASPAREKSVSPARSPQTHLLPQQVKPSGAKDDGESPYSPRTTRHKHSPSSRRADGGHKRAPSHDHISPSKRRRSSPGRTPQRSSDRRVGSPQKHSSVSPRRRDSPRKRGKSVSRSPVGKRGRSLSRSPVGKRGRSVSRSPVGKRGRSVSQSPVGKRGRSVSRSPSGRKAASGYKRDRHDRSRSRSPHSRDRYRRSPRRRHSPRRRSPPTGYHSRRHSPRRRPWSPPSNRSTGVGRPGKNLFVAGFSFVTTERDLEKKFSRFGRVTDVRIVRDKRSGDSRGFGFLSLERDEDADAAIRALDQTEWNGRIVLVEKSKTGR